MPPRRRPIPDQGLTQDSTSCPACHTTSRCSQRRRSLTSYAHTRVSPCSSHPQQLHTGTKTSSALTKTHAHTGVVLSTVTAGTMRAISRVIRNRHTDFRTATSVDDRRRITQEPVLAHYTTLPDDHPLGHSSFRRISTPSGEFCRTPENFVGLRRILSPSDYNCPTTR